MQQEIQGRSAGTFAVVAIVMGILGLLAGPVWSQSRFDPIIRVNESVITQYELDQRVLLLRALGAPGDLSEEARNRLIDERLQIEVGKSESITAKPEAIEAGITEFAGRANVTGEQFLRILAQRGVARESFEDFVEAGVVWRELVRSRFVGRARVSEKDVDKAVALAGQEGGARVLISEILLPARNEAEATASEARAQRLSRINGFQAFSAAARSFSVAPSRGRGGRVDWVPLNRLPPQLRGQLLSLPIGGVTQPIRSGNVIAVFQLRDLQEVAATAPEVVSLDYAEFRLPGGTRDDARKVANRIDTCDDLYGIARKLPEDRLVREVRPVADIPQDIRAQLALLDEDEVTLDIRRGDLQLLVMLCGRTTASTVEVDRAQIRQQLLNQRVESYANGFLAELRADAVIVDLQ